MFANMLKKDISRSKTITATLFLFIFLAAMLVSVAVHIIITLFGGIDHLFELSRAPHFVQMTAEEINQNEIDTFAQNNPLVESWQTVIMLDIDGTNIYLGNNEESQIASIMDNSFVVQNRRFDFLLDFNNDIIHVNDGEIAVPIHHMQRYGLQLGDIIRIVDRDFDMTFIITAFARDVQMNPSIVTSNRFLISENDWQALHSNFIDLEYLISFRLHDVGRVGEFEAMYQASGLPQTGVSLTYSLYSMLNAITDGVLAAVIILISLLLILIAALCLRFTLTAAIEEDYREIGAMKAIGINSKDIRHLYMVKYTTMGH